MLVTTFHLLVFVFGLCVGSFLNCVIYRLEKGKSFLSSRSYCPKCKKQLALQDIVPVISFLVLRGRCRYCRKKISWQYPLVEIATGLLFLLIFPTGVVSQFYGTGNFQIFLEFIVLAVISCLLIIIFVYDLKHYLISDKIIHLAILFTFFWRLFEVWNLGFKGLLNPFISACLASAFFLTLVLVSKEQWMGLGDVKLAFFMGLFLGFPNILVALFLSFLFGALIGVFLIFLGRKGMKSRLAFAPFLISGTFAAFFWGSKIIEWYLSPL